MDLDQKNKNKNIVSLIDFKQKKAIESEHSGGRNPLYMSHKTGRMTGSPHLRNSTGDQDFGDRIRRIRNSLDRINNLMAELKRMASDDDKQDKSAKK